jgi:hypothetical protein
MRKKHYLSLLFNSAIYRQLLNAIFYMADGNFHLQLRLLAKALDEDPSLFGNSGFWASIELQKSFLAEANALKSSLFVLSFSGSILVTNVLLERKMHSKGCRF